MTHWIRFEHGGRTGFGILQDDTIVEHEGDMYTNPVATGRSVRLSEVEVLTPSVPSKMIALWNNFHARAKKENLSEPEHPLYFLKAPNSFAPDGYTLQRQRFCEGRIVYEGELGIVIGRECQGISEDEADDVIFGYTCVNDITAADLLRTDPNFVHWVRSKSFDGFGVFGPVIATGLDPAKLSVRTVLNGVERQNYPLSDMIFTAQQQVSLISQDMTLVPGDVIACGTSLGAGSMKEPRNTVEIVIEGIGTLRTVFEQ